MFRRLATGTVFFLYNYGSKEQKHALNGLTHLKDVFN